ncbi:MAG: DUF2085 domain-containing protein [Candidatus Methanomethylophilaceae archaeon]
MSVRHFANLLFAVFGLLLLCVVLAPLLAPSGTMTDLDGRVGTVDHEESWEVLDPFTGMVYRVGDYFCHQISERSLTINDNQLPLCARDLGVLAGFVLGAFLFLIFPRTPPWWVIAALVAPIVLDGGLQALSDYVSCNPMRLSTGLLGGAGAFLGMLRLMQGWWDDLMQDEG